MSALESAADRILITTDLAIHSVVGGTFIARLEQRLRARVQVDLMLSQPSAASTLKSTASREGTAASGCTDQTPTTEHVDLRRLLAGTVLTIPRKSIVTTRR